MCLRRLLSCAALTLIVTGGVADAQPIGTFGWQLQPYCNVVTLDVVRQGAVYALDGFDDQCGAGQHASVVGTAFLNPDGSVGIGLTTVLAPGGSPVHVDARINVGSLSGPWRDSSGNSGTFAFTTGASTGGSARPVVAPTQYGSVLTQPPGGTDKGLRIVVPTASSTDSAAVHGQLGNSVDTLTFRAAVKGDSADFIGVLGQSATGAGMVGVARSGIGMWGIANDQNGVGVVATNGAPAGIALRVAGGIELVGPNAPAFVHTVTAQTQLGLCTLLDHPLLNGDPEAIVIATQVVSFSFIASEFAVLYGQGQGKWTICQPANPFPVGQKFNVLVIKQ